MFELNKRGLLEEEAGRRALDMGIVSSHHRTRTLTMSGILLPIAAFVDGEQS